MEYFLENGEYRESLFEKLLPHLQDYQLLTFKIQQLRCQNIQIYTDRIAKFKEWLLDSEIEILRAMEPDLLKELGL